MSPAYNLWLILHPFSILCDYFIYIYWVPLFINSPEVCLKNVVLNDVYLYLKEAFSVKSVKAGVKFRHIKGKQEHP